MNRTASIILAAILCVIFVSIIYFLIRNTHEPKDQSAKQIEQINNLRIEIVKLDSIRKREQRRQIDSMMQGIKITQTQLEKIDKITIKLRQQNEKLDLLYNSLHTDMPEF